MGGAPLRKYEVTVNGHVTTLSLNDADAALYGVGPNASTAPAVAEPPEKTRTPQNKARTPRQK